jgi:hypothetical protein
MQEPIRQVQSDNKRERIVAQRLEQKMPWSLFPTPKFYFTDFHINRLQDNGRQNYIGDLEIKWLNIPSNYPAIFPFNKLQQMLIAPPYTDSPDSFHRICFRFNDGMMIVPAKDLARIVPEVHTRKDTNETDMVIKVLVSDYTRYFKPIIVNE